MAIETSVLLNMRLGLDGETSEAVGISPDGGGAVDAPRSVLMESDSFGSEESSPVLRFFGPFLLVSPTLVLAR